MGYVEARRVEDSDLGAEGAVTAIMSWSGAYAAALSDVSGHGWLELATPEGMVRVVPGDWIVEYEDGFRRRTADEMAEVEAASS